MIDLSLLANVLGLFAGSILLISGFPVLREELLSNHERTPGERLSRLAMAVGNGAWVIVGILSGLWAVTLMCGVNALIQLFIFLKSKTRNPE